MDKSMNILILSCGTRNKIVQYFKKELNGKGQVIATDSSELAPALYDADKYFIVPKVSEDGYLDIILNLCKENNIKAVLSLIDPELTLLAENKEKFLEVGTIPIVSDYDMVELCFNKYEFYKYLVENDIKTIRSYVDKEMFYKDVEKKIIDYPVFVKPVRGSASINISKVTNKDEIELLFSKHNNLMIQEYIDGIEYGADVYVDMISSKMSAIFIKEKIKMRAGETDKSISFKDEKLFDLINEFLGIINFKGVIDIDIFKVNEEYYISEVNPRFGGGYPHAFECGVNIPKMIINNLNGEKNEHYLCEYDQDVYMMKFNEVKIIKKR